MASATITALYRYPVKGFSAEQLAGVTLVPGEELPFDRAFAIENGPSGFNTDQPETLPKIRFLMLMRNERIARFESRFDAAIGKLTITREGNLCVSGALDETGGRQQIEAWIAEAFADDLRGPPRILRAPGHSFSDVSAKVLHLINLDSIRALESQLGRPVDPMRFRANMVIDGAAPFAELDWPGRRISIGDAVLTVVSRTERCAATNVDPATATRDMQLPRSLMNLYGHTDFGIYLRVDRGGQIAAGDRISVADKDRAGLPFS